MVQAEVRQHPFPKLSRRQRRAARELRREQVVAAVLEPVAVEQLERIAEQREVIVERREPIEVAPQDVEVHPQPLRDAAVVVAQLRRQVRLTRWS